MTELELAPCMSKRNSIPASRDREVLSSVLKGTCLDVLKNDVKVLCNMLPIWWGLVEFHVFL